MMASMMGNRIARARISAGYLSQGALANAVGVSRGLVGQWESHIKQPGRDNLAKVAQLCGTSMDYLQGDTTEMHGPIVISDEQEIQLILLFRSCPARGRKALLDLAMTFKNATPRTPLEQLSKTSV